MKTRKIICLFSLSFLCGGISLCKSKVISSHDGVIVNEVLQKRNTKTLAIREIQSLNNSKYTIDFFATAKDFAQNTFSVIKFLPAGYVIYNNLNGDIMEISSNANFNYTKEQIEGSYYVPLYGFFKIDKGLALEVNNHNMYYSEEKVAGYSKELAKSYHFYEDEDNIEYVLYNSKVENSLIKKTDVIDIGSTTSPLPKASWEVPGSYLFRNFIEIPSNTSSQNRCGYVAMSLLLYYNDILFPGYFSSLDYVSYTDKARGLPQNENCAPSLNSSFIDYYWSEAGSSRAIPLGDLVDDFLEGKNISYDCKTRMGPFGSIEDLIKDGTPVALFGNLESTYNPSTKVNHAIVIYGLYNDGNYLTHYGYSNRSQVKISPATLFEKGSLLWIENYQKHSQHRAYFEYPDSNGSIKWYCSCGIRIQR